MVPSRIIVNGEPCWKSLQKGRAVPGLEADFTFFISSFMQQKSVPKRRLKEDARNYLMIIKRQVFSLCVSSIAV